MPDGIAFAPGMRVLSQTTTLVISETDPRALEMLTKHPILFLQVLDDVLLLPV